MGGQLLFKNGQILMPLMANGRTHIFLIMDALLSVLHLWNDMEKHPVIGCYANEIISIYVPVHETLFHVITCTGI